MSQKKRNAKQITKKKEYLQHFTKKKCSRALKEALDIRKFEIDLYWKRTGFFWAFITVIYTALFAVICKYVECSTKYSFLVPVISVLSGLGLFFSYAWHMVNKGSKFWQKNWETHVSLLEKNVIGPLYDIYLNPKIKILSCPIKEVDFSVSKVNMWASCIITLCSLLGGIGCVLWLILCRKERICFVVCPYCIVFLFTILMRVFSHGNNDIEVKGTRQDELDMIYIN